MNDHYAGFELDSTQTNIKNRLVFWGHALSQVELNLLLAERAEAWREKNGQTADIAIKGGVQYDYSRDDPFHSLRERPFPTLFECDQVVESALPVAVFFHCHLLKNSKADGTRTASNSNNFKDSMWRYAKVQLKNIGIDENIGDELNTKLENIREGVIAHADASAFSPSYGDDGQIKSYTPHWVSCEDIDRVTWMKIAVHLKNQIFRIS